MSDQTAPNTTPIMECHACDTTGRTNGHPLRRGCADEPCGDCAGTGKHPHASRHMFNEMWRRKAERKDHFAHATLTRDVTVALNPGDVTDHRMRTIKAGTRVLCTVVSRFGDIGIRDSQIHDIRHGYCARVFPAALRDVQWAEGTP